VKKIHLALLATLLIGSCASKPAVNPDEVSLNMAIRQAAARMETRLGAGTKVALVNFTSPSQVFSEYVLDELSSVLVNDGILTVVDRANLDRIRQELGLNTSGEVSEMSMQKIGQMLGAQALVTGSLTSIADLRRVMFKVIITETAAVAVQHPADIINDRRIQALLAQGGGSQSVMSYGAASAGGHSGGSAASGGKAATPAKPAGPANGTYTLWPRPQAYDSGVAVRNVFLAQMVYTDEYTVIYFANSAQGTFANGTGGTSTYCWQEWKTLQLQDLDNPTKFYTPVNAEQSNNGGGTIWWISFKRLPVKRFKLVADSWGNLQTFYEVIVPDRPD